jgi:uncharacterized protein (DUF2267 family)
MSSTGLAVFESTIHKSNQWLQELMALLGTDDKQRAYAALRAALHALRDRLSVDESAQFGAQLPMLLRGLYYDGWDPSRVPLRLRHLEDFLERVRESLPPDEPLQIEALTRAVFALLAQRISAGEIRDVRRNLPEALAGLWP